MLLWKIKQTSHVLGEEEEEEEESNVVVTSIPMMKKGLIFKWEQLREMRFSDAYHPIVDVREWWFAYERRETIDWSWAQSFSVLLDSARAIHMFDLLL